MKSYVTYETAVQASIDEFLIRFFIMIALLLLILELIGWWKLLEKAGVKGWYALVPGLNLWCFFSLAVGSGWKSLLMWIPVFGLLYFMYAIYKFGSAFGASPVICAFSMIFSPFFFYWMGTSDEFYYLD